MKCSRALALTLAACLLAVSGAHAQRGDEDVSLRGSDVPSFAQQRDMILGDMQEGGKYAEISAEAREQVIAALDEMVAILGSHGAIGQLSAEEKIRLFNAQERANAVLKVARADSRMLCKRERKVGSHFKTSICNTVAEWKLQQEAAGEAMNQKQRGPICVGFGECGPPAQGPPRF